MSGFVSQPRKPKPRWNRKWMSGHVIMKHFLYDKGQRLLHYGSTVNSITSFWKMWHMIKRISYVSLHKKMHLLESWRLWVKSVSTPQMRGSRITDTQTNGAFWWHMTCPYAISRLFKDCLSAMVNVWLGVKLMAGYRGPHKWCVLQIQPNKAASLGHIWSSNTGQGRPVDLLWCIWFWQCKSFWRHTAVVAPEWWQHSYNHLHWDL